MQQSPHRCPEGLLVGYLECDDFAGYRAAMKEYAVNARWQTKMAPFFKALDGDDADDMISLEKSFIPNKMWFDHAPTP